MPDVVVKDLSGAPIEGAKIVAHSLSMSGLTTYTDSRGQARVPSSIQATKWITVSKAGYQSRWMELDATNPMVVVLEHGSDADHTLQGWNRVAPTNGGLDGPLFSTNSLWKISQ